MHATEWRFVVATSPGAAHLQTGLPCEDHATCALVEGCKGAVLVAVVADGAGSAFHSDAGAEIAVDALVALISAYLADGCVSHLTQETVKGWIGEVRSSLERLARSEGADLDDYACTLLAAIAGIDRTACLQVGDGAIVISGESATWSPVFWPQHGEFANSTNFVTSPAAPSALDFTLLPHRVDRLALFTDGLEDLVLHRATRSGHARFFDAMFQPLEKSAASGCDERLSAALGDFLSSPWVCERTGDDKTLVLAYRPNGCCLTS